MRTPPALPLLALAAALLALALGPTGALASDAGSEVRASTLVTATGEASYLSIPVLGGVHAGGAVTSYDGAAITDGSATWTDNQFNGPAGRYYLLITSGSAAGWHAEIVATEAAARRVTLARALPSNLAVGDRYRVRAFDRIDALFGGVNASALQAAGNPSDADNVLLFDAAAQRVSTLFLSDVSGYAGWFDADYAAAGGRIVAPATGFIVRRRAAGAAQLAWTGVDRAENLRVTILPGLNLIGLAQAKASVPLEELELVTGNPANGLASGSDAASAADTLIAPPKTYFFADSVGQLLWRDETNAPAGTATLPIGAGFFIRRGGAAFDWTINTHE